MTRAIPGPLGRVPAHRASHVRADRGAQGHRARRVAICRDLRAIAFDDLSLAASDRTEGFRLGSGKPIAKSGSTGSRRSPSRSPTGRASSAFRPGSNNSLQGLERPRTASEIMMPAKRAECQAIARVSRRRVLMVRARADVREPIGRLDDLTRPAVGQVDIRKLRLGAALRGADSRLLCPPVAQFCGLRRRRFTTSWSRCGSTRRNW